MDSDGGEKERTGKGVKIFCWLARPLTSGYVYLSSLRVRPLSCYFQQSRVEKVRVMLGDCTCFSG